MTFRCEIQRPDILHDIKSTNPDCFNEATYFLVSLRPWYPFGPINHGYVRIIFLMDPILGLERASFRKRTSYCKVLDYSLFFSSLPLFQQLLMIVNVAQIFYEMNDQLDITQLCFALLPQVNFPANNLNFY